ncbi:gluconokinase [Colwellia piezophila]|uniref:gluconokinase n=1 Tax=Colwellia piezophila TaxID=211668 RepID=UPI0003600040|nr:gluconokinase [Colwellia piezophila]
MTNKAQQVLAQHVLEKKVPHLFIVMGVSGTGKSSLAKTLADEHSLIFVDADDFHSEQAKKYMAENKPLTDEMRAPWLAAILKHLNSLYQQGQSVALAYSGLKSAHRNLFRDLPFYCHFFYLTANKEVIAKRMAQRENHFFSPALLASQFAAMQAPLLSESDVSPINSERPFLLVANEINKLSQLVTRKVMTKK